MIAGAALQLLAAFNSGGSTFVAEVLLVSGAILFDAAQLYTDYADINDVILG